MNSPVKTEWWHRIVGKFVLCEDEPDESSFAPERLGELLAVYGVALGADIQTVDLRALDSVESALSLLAVRLRFPDYFGHNLDALYDIAGESADQFQVQLDAKAHGNLHGQVGELSRAVPHVWLILTQPSQAKMLFPIMDTLRDAMSQTSGVGLSILWANVSAEA